MSAIVIDTSRWPLVVHSVEGSPSPNEVDEYIVRATEILERKHAHVTVLDARRASGASAYTRARSREWIRAHRAELAAFCAGTVYVVSSPLLRFVVMTTLVLTPMPTDYFVCETLEEALAWGDSQLAKRDDRKAR